jgi:hypothetical protein
MPVANYLSQLHLFIKAKPYIYSTISRKPNPVVAGIVEKPKDYFCIATPGIITDCKA